MARWRYQAADGSAARMTPLSADAVPHLRAAQERAVRGIAVVAYAYTLYWLWWRWTKSLNPQAPVFSVLLVLAETLGAVGTGFLILTVWRLTHRRPPPPKPGLAVDVFITCYDEPMQLIRLTAIGARAIAYPHATYVLDDGKRDAVRAMCEDLGVQYIRRPDNAHAKAGNLNHALTVTRGEFILQLDADHVPLPHILDRLLGYFDDPAVAFVQSPQDFYNTDSFTHVLSDRGRRLWEDNRLFFSLVLPGKDRFNAAFFCGSSGALRRGALESVGGFGTQTVTEDMETSILLHAAGWKSVYHGEALAYGLSPASAGQYHIQRLRWGQGAMQILRKLNPLTRPGLTPMQRMGYFSSAFVYADGLIKLMFYLAPVTFLFTGWLPVHLANRELIERLIPYLLLSILSFETLTRGTGYLLTSERYNMTKFFTYILALSGLFIRKPLKFNVTPKAEGSVPWRVYAPQLAIGALSAAALAWATIASRYGWVDYHVPGWHSAAFRINAIWCVWNMSFAFDCVRRSLHSRQRRSDYRFAQSMLVVIRALGDGAPAALAIADPGVDDDAIAEELNTAGLSFRSTRRYERLARITVCLPLSPDAVITAGRVAHSRATHGRAGIIYQHAMLFEDLPATSREAIERHCAHHAVPMPYQPVRVSVDTVAHAVEWFTDLRARGRRAVGLPARVTRHSPEGAFDLGGGVLEEMSDDGARLMLADPVEPGTVISYVVPGTTCSGRGTVVFSRLLESPLRARFAVGVRRERHGR